MKNRKYLRKIYNFISTHKIISVFLIAFIFAGIISSIFIPTVVLKDRKEEYKKISMFVKENNEKICDLFEIINTDTVTELTVEDMDLNFKNDNVKISNKYGTRYDQYIIYQYKDNQLVKISEDWRSKEFIIMNIMIFLAVLLFSAFLRYLLENLFFILIN